MRYIDKNHIGISLDETTTIEDLYDLINCFENDKDPVTFDIHEDAELNHIPAGSTRHSKFLTHPVFNSHHSETQMMRYIKMLENKDLSLNTSMISLGSCTMKLNAASEMIPLSWDHWSKIHPFAPADQTAGYKQIIDELSKYLCEHNRIGCMQPATQQRCTGRIHRIINYPCIIMNANGDHHRNVMLIPISAHGTNPASAQ